MRQYALRILRARKDILIMSVGALVDPTLLGDLRSLAVEMKVYVPSGAIAGLDGVRAAAVGNLAEAILTSRKPPEAFKGSPYAKAQGLRPEAIKAPTVVYEGTAVEACKLFPTNVNVAATLSIACLGPEKTRVHIVVEPGVGRGVHEVMVNGDSGELITQTHNVPFAENPATSYLAALSAVATLRRITETMTVGT